MQSDHDRPLAPRGRRDAVRLSEHIAASGIAPQLVLASTARRSVETVQAVDPGGEVVFEPRLYGASADELLARLRSLDDRLEEVMVVGHNPALQMLILSLVADGSSVALAQVREKLPTGALASLSFEGSWAELSPAGVELGAYVRPKALQYS